MPTEINERIQWLPWGEQAFAQARDEDKLIILDIGATWCHWCHVMDRQTYEDPGVAAAIRERFVAVRVDRDRMSELDAAMQRTQPLVQTGTQAGGWPLTVILTPEGHILFKATFVPARADPQFGVQAGLLEILAQVDEYWRSHRQALAAAGAKIAGQVHGHHDDLFARPGDPGEAQIEAVVAGLKDAYDPRHGGFGEAPKFFAASSLELLLAQAWRGDADAREMVAKTLDSIARGGVCDQVGGGFHRYSVDEHWHVPHFEKMAGDNAAMLAVFANAHALTGREDFARIAVATIGWIADTLGGQGESRGFFASQDADVGPDDDGDYFTWTPKEVAAACGGDADAAIAYFDVDDFGDMHSRPGRSVLHVPKTVRQHAMLSNTDEAQFARRVEQARAKLLDARRKRTAPAVDRTIFADANGMLIDALLTAWRRLGHAQAKDMALAKLDCVLADLRDWRGVFAHYRQGGQLDGVGLLADQAWMGRALVHAYTVTLRQEYLDAAAQAARYIAMNLASDDGGLLNLPAPAENLPTTVQPSRGWEDSPTRSAASVAADLMTDLGYLLGDARLAAAGAKALASFAGGVDRGWGTFLAGYALSLDRLLHGPRSIVVVAPAGDAGLAALSDAANHAYIPAGLAMTLELPKHQAIAERLGHAVADSAVAYVCGGKACLPPAHNVDELRERIEELRKTD